MTTDTTDAPDTLTIDYRPGRVRDLRVAPPPADAEPARRHAPATRTPAVVTVDGEDMAATPRFWSSVFHRFGLTGNVFRYFDAAEVFARVVDRNADDRLRLCVERRGPDKLGRARKPRLLAVSNPRRGVLEYGPTGRLIAEHGGGELAYADGVLTARHTPRSGEAGFHIGPDEFRNRFVVECPVDGFGGPRLYLSLLRQVCANGAVGYGRAFRSDVRVGADAAHTLARALGQFDHDEGFAALRQRFESAQKSWASVGEVMELRKTLARTSLSAATMGGLPHDGGTNDNPDGELLVQKLDRIAGDLHGTYGLSNLQALSAKRQRVLPARCRVYDLLNLASEVATHRARPAAARSLQAYIGTLISDEYDLEGTAERVPEFDDLFLGAD